MLVSEAGSFAPGKWKRRARRFVGRTLNTLDGEEHRRRRVLLQPALDRRRIAGFAPAIDARADRAVSSWESGATVRLRDLLDPLSLAVAGEVLLSTELQPRLGHDLAAVMAAVPRLTPPVHGSAGGRALARVEAAIQQLTDERRDMPNRDDLLGALLQAGLPERVVRGEVTAFLLAAVDEPPAALEAACFLIARHPRVEAALLDEAEGEYLEAVLRETLRLFPPARHIDRCPVRDVRIGDERVRRGANVIVSPVVSHRDRATYERADEFVPERWLEGRQTARGEYLPFGVGVHACIGEPLARAIMTSTLRAIVRTWELRLGPTATAPTPRSPRLVVTLERR